MNLVQMTKVVRSLLIIYTTFFIIQLFGDTFLGLRVTEALSLIPNKVISHGYIWQVFTFHLMHSDLFHWLFNMLILWSIGSELESQWGSTFFLKYFFVCTFAAGLLYIIAALLFGSFSAIGIAPMLGTSAGVYGLLVAYGIIYSERTMVFMFAFPMKAKHFVMVLGGIELISTVFYSRNGASNIAHLGGMVVGFAFLFVKAWVNLRKKDSQTKGSKRTRKFQKSHLQLVVNNEVLNQFDDDGGSGDGRPTFH